MKFKIFCMRRDKILFAVLIYEQAMFQNFFFQVDHLKSGLHFPIEI
jgi:hypothetical protein